MLMKMHTLVKTSKTKINKHKEKSFSSKKKQAQLIHTSIMQAKTWQKQKKNPDRELTENKKKVPKSKI